MRHRRRTKYFSRKFNARKALFRGLMVSLVEHGRITTTVAKAKELRRKIERAITTAKKNDLNSRRLLLTKVPNEETVSALLGEIAPRFKERAGGYTRIIKIGRRPGDTAEMAFIEFVDFDWKARADKMASLKGEGKATKENAEAKRNETKKKRASAKIVAAKRKNIRRIQSSDRAANRA